MKYHLYYSSDHSNVFKMICLYHSGLFSIGESPLVKRLFSLIPAFLIFVSAMAQTPHQYGTIIEHQSGGWPIIYMGQDYNAPHRFLQLIGSTNSTNAGGIKVGGLLVADYYGYASPGRNDLVTKGTISVGRNSSLNGAGLTVKGPSNATWQMLAFDGNTDDWFMGSFGGGGFFIGKDDFGSGSTRFVIKDKLIGLGTNAPQSKLHIEGSNNTESQISLVNTANNTAWTITPMFNDDRLSFRANNSNYEEVMILHSSGNVGIGTTNPDAKLAVKGDIHTQEVKVDLNGAIAPDYVFEEDYDLRSLEETESYIQANKHLPEIPSATEMEENGFELKEMNLKLLQKIEELTLYLIEQNKQIEAQQNRIEQLEKKVSGME